jgi:hypothetical protein
MLTPIGFLLFVPTLSLTSPRCDLSVALLLIGDNFQGVPGCQEDQCFIFRMTNRGVLRYDLTDTNIIRYRNILPTSLPSERVSNARFMAQEYAPDSRYPSSLSRHSHLVSRSFGSLYHRDKVCRSFPNR